MEDYSKHAFNIKDIFQMFENEPSDKSIYLNFIDSKETLRRHYNVFYHEDLKDYFFITEKPVTKRRSMLKLIDLQNVIKPYIKKSKNVQYEKNIVLFLNFREKEESWNILNEIISHIYKYTESSIKISEVKNNGVDDEQASYLLLIENLEFLFQIHFLMEKYKTVNYEIYREYKFHKKIRGRIFVKNGEKPYYYEFMYNYKNFFLVGDSEKILFKNVEKDKNLLFEDVFNFVQFDFHETIEIKENNREFQDFNLEIGLSKSDIKNRTFEQLLKHRDKMHKELRRAEKNIARMKDISSKKYFESNYAGFFVSEKDLNNLYYIFRLYDKKDIEKIMVYSFSKKKDFQRELFYFFYGPEYLLPKQHQYFYTEDENYSVNDFKILIPYGTKITPQFNILENQELYNKFLNTLIPNNDSLNKKDHFLIIDDNKTFFDKEAILINKTQGRHLDEFIYKYAKFDLGDDFETYSVQFMFENNNSYDSKIENKMKDYFNSVVEDIDFEIEKAIDSWEKSKTEITTEDINNQNKLNLLLEDINLFDEKINNYFENETLMNLLNHFISNINTYKNEIREETKESIVKKIVKEDYEKINSKYKTTLDEYNNTYNNLKNQKDEKNVKLNNLKEKIEKKIEEINILKGEYEKLERELYDDFINNKEG